MDLSICVALSASWRADFSRNGCRRRLVPGFCDPASIPLAIADAPDNSVNQSRMVHRSSTLNEGTFSV